MWVNYYLTNIGELAKEGIFFLHFGCLAKKQILDLEIKT